MVGTLLLNRYELLEKIGEGGMGIVYKAKCSLLNRFVAVKILKSELSTNEDFIARFKREANSVANLSYPGIVSIYDVGVENNINFIIMEYIKGKTLKQIIKENSRLSPLKTLEISSQIAKALQYAHKNNIIHRDVKPDNIILTEDNIVKLMDFGIAKVTDSVTLTNSNKIIGSVHYFSPEQAKGKFIDHRTDIYSLGIVMYEMITGQVPFNGDTSISIAMMHIQEPIIPPQEIIHDIPENINKVILKALEKDPIDRFQTAKELFDISNLLKDNLSLNLNLNTNSIDTAKTMILEENTLLPDTISDSTVVLKQEEIPETILLKENTEKSSKENIIKNNNSKNKRIILIAGLIIFSIITGVLGKYIFKGTSDDTLKKPLVKTDIEKTDPEKSTVSNESKTPPDNEKKIVPLLKGKTQSMAESLVTNNGFLLGNVTTEYSDTIPKGLIINQSPVADTYYEDNGTIDLVISQGQKVNQVIPQTKQNGNNNGNGNGKDKEDKPKKGKNK
ncbi:Stk1 family PASTA domain-containing Ser/Thr kinase [Clostridium sp.]|uniref:Stk1 family PASTA domain-containing Ser/Thr kinase n=1 Tax=Clostridium sp. TaxID=1506 RepID=UPI00284C2C18|nr:Stk1 family PASTA domain-containing Ser/Thr kinase [Clostridium sp.]MDR3596199.1 Stk1 family PASTA domain-containing Ser/Thr kinase [Clostridium sp.]